VRVAGERKTVRSPLNEGADSEVKKREPLQAAPVAMVVVNQGTEIVLLNRRAEERVGHRRDKRLGQRVTNIIPEGFTERLIANDLRFAEDLLEKQIGAGIGLTRRREGGGEFPIETMPNPLESTGGILVAAALRDVCVSKIIEIRRTQMEGHYRELLEAAPDAMVVVNQRGEIVLLNLQAEKKFGYRRDELLGQPVTNIIPKGLAEDDLRSAEGALAQPIGAGIELTGRCKDGGEFPIEVMLGPMESVEGLLVTAAIRDITTRKRAEAVLLKSVRELNRSNEELRQFAYMASHDLQEPSRMVASYTQLLSRRYKGRLDTEADELIAFAVDGAIRMQRLIHDLLAFSRVGSKPRELVDTSSADALEQALSNLRGVIEESGARVTYNALPIVRADKQQLSQLFQNLVGNAIKYQRGATPLVHIAAVRTRDKKWMFGVSDNGLGIAPQYFEKIFGMFQRLHKSDEFAGTGIGLAICRKIAERHGSTISVESVLGRGSTFSFALIAGEQE
jgi:PAS domain S-box-containing protein